MLICGLKFTHDGAIALIKDGKLIFNIEIEKLDNNPRYSEILDTTIIKETLKTHGYTCEDVDIFAVDGWGGYSQEALAIQPRLRIGKNCNYVALTNGGAKEELKVSAYEEKNLAQNILHGQSFNGLKIGSRSYDYISYLHVTGHIMGSYLTSPFASIAEGSYVLIWDGGMFPRLYFFDAQKREIKNLGPISFYVGNVYTIFSQHFGPFKKNLKHNFAKDDLSIAGKVMAYIAYGEVKNELFSVFDSIYKNNYSHPMGFANVFANKFKEAIRGSSYSDEDVLMSFHKYLEEHLIEKVKKKISRFNFNCSNLCMSGGCALNIKWNTAIRSCGIFSQVYIPPFPNDSGSALGVASVASYFVDGTDKLEWDVFRGPDIFKSTNDHSWEKKRCSISELAELIHETGEPVVVLNGKAELGPRALGHRSILASATSVKMKDILNKIKKRESYRPISPICLEIEAKKIFNPGTRDTFMLFDHKIQEGWKEKIPAVAHIDGTARLQTVGVDNEFTFALLTAYKKVSGIPVLCNTSANNLGKGFFPDVRSAIEWGKTNYVWCNNILYTNNKKIELNGNN